MLAQLMSEMVRHQRPMTVRPEAAVAGACRQVGERRVAAVLVADADNHMLGIFTRRNAVGVLAQGCAATDPMRLMQDGRRQQVPAVDHGVVVAVVYWGDFSISEHDQLGTETYFCDRT